MKSAIVPTFTCEIYLAGSMADIERQCAEYCMEVGLCVSVEPVRFIYTGGREDGDAPYWIALTILAIQFFGAGRE